MVNAAIVFGVWRRYRLLWAAVVALLLGFVVVFMLAANSFVEERNLLEALPEWVRRLMNAMAGTDVSAMLTPTGIASFVFTHPLMWVLLTSFTIAVASGLLAGEVDRGTMDLLATLPVSRGRIYASLTAGLMAMGLPLCWVVFAGACIGRWIVGGAEVDVGLLAVVACHLCAAYVFLALWSLAVSAMCSRRGTAVAIAFGAIFYSFVLNVLAAYWTALGRLAFTGFLHYYGPLKIVRDGEWRLGDLAVLLGAGAFCWVAGLVVFSRRDIRAT